MKQTIEIEVPDGKKAVWKDGKIVFEDVKLPKTWEEYCCNNNIKKGEAMLNASSYTQFNMEYERNPKTCSNIVPSKEAANQHIALIKLHQLRDCYRQGWKPNWNDENTKYSIYYDDRYWIGTYNIRHFLSFQTKEIAEEFLHNFRDLIKQAGDLV